MITEQLYKQRGYFAIRETRIIDGDTIEATVALPFGALARKRIRLRGWWTDEITGPYAECGLLARCKLYDFLEGKALWIHCPGERCDRYGRIVAHLVYKGQLVDPKVVLGHLQLTETEHRAHRAAKAAVVVW